MAPSRDVLLLLLASTLLACVVASRSFDDHLATVVDPKNKAVEWDYTDGPNGIAHWGELNPDWATCIEGGVYFYSGPSPINVDEEFIQLDGTLDVPAKILYKPAPAYLISTGRTVEVAWAGGIFSLHDFDYPLSKLIFHAPSEHTYFGVRHPLEVQFYHNHETEGPAINSVHFKVGQPNEWLEQFMHGLRSAGSNLSKPFGLGMVDSAGVNADDLDYVRYYRYLGGLTTPPCFELTYWSLLKTVYEASEEQIAVITNALSGPNYRPTFPLGTRHLYYPRSAATN